MAFNINADNSSSSISDSLPVFTVNSRPRLLHCGTQHIGVSCRKYVKICDQQWLKYQHLWWFIFEIKLERIQVYAYNVFSFTCIRNGNEISIRTLGTAHNSGFPMEVCYTQNFICHVSHSGKPFQSRVLQGMASLEVPSTCGGSKQPALLWIMAND